MLQITTSELSFAFCYKERCPSCKAPIVGIKDTILSFLIPFKYDLSSDFSVNVFICEINKIANIKNCLIKSI